MCELVPNLDEMLSFLPNTIVFSCCHQLNVVISLHNTRHWCFLFVKIINENYLTRIQKIDAKTLLGDWTVFVLSGTDSSLSVHCFDRSLVSGVMWWIHGYGSTQNSVLLWRNIAKHSIEVSLIRCFCTIVNKRGNHLEHSFLMSKFSINMRCTALFEMLTVSASWRIFSRWSFNRILWIFFTISGVVTSFDPPLDFRLGKSYGLV